MVGREPLEMVGTWFKDSNSTIYFGVSKEEFHKNTGISESAFKDKVFQHHVYVKDEYSKYKLMTLGYNSLKEGLVAIKEEDIINTINYLIKKEKDNIHKLAKDCERIEKNCKKIRKDLETTINLFN
ncbi:MAG: hypothetical protein JSW73_00425 [Candidatus Woesearchaeota archaeon]|nr:MAG: hypothetical protein JSW73_00425 [Candidatus Woesearchaeota archaeon]